MSFDDLARSGSSASSARRSLSIVVPVLNECDNVGPMHTALFQMAATLPECEFEFLFVDDGSTDATYQRLQEIHATDPRLKVLRLSRNFGSHIAAAAGLQLCSGDGAVIMAGDLQDHPKEIPRFVEKWREGFHVVWGVRASRQERALDRLLSRAFAEAIRRIALPNYPSGGTGSFCLIDRLVIDALNAFPERNRMTFGLILYAGFRQVGIPYDRLARHSGSSKWSFRRKVRVAIDTVISFSSTPIRLVSLAGFVIASCSFAFSAYLVFYRLAQGTEVPGWTTTIGLIGILGGAQLLFLGLLGEYLWRTLDDVRRRPLYFIEDATGSFNPRRQDEPGGRPEQH
jgi:glycosyltransferase involved in cell wall biosynthesis